MPIVLHGVIPQTVTFNNTNFVQVDHNLGRTPMTQLIDDVGNVRIDSGIQHINNNTFTMTQTIALSGKILYF